MIMGPFGLNGFILYISVDILFGPSDSSWSWMSILSIREDVANAIKCQICNGESTKLWHCPWLRNGPISYRYEVTVLMETEIPDHALVSDFIKNGHGNLSPSRSLAGQCLMQEIALYELPQLPVEDRIVWSLSPDGN